MNVTFYLCFYLHLDMSGFDTVADIRLSARNAVILHLNGFKFKKNRTNALITSWSCNKRTAKANCKASAQTIDVNGVTMAKMFVTEHTHEPEEDCL